MKKRIFGTAMACAAVLGAFNPNEVSAADEKTVAAPFCTYQYPNYRLTTNYSDYFVQSIDTYTNTIVCPLTRDNMTAKPHWFKAYVRNDNGNDPVTCRGYNKSNSNYAYWFNSASTSSTGNQTLTIDMSAVGDYDYGSFTVECDLKYRDSIRQVRWRES